MTDKSDLYAAVQPALMVVLGALLAFGAQHFYRRWTRIDQRRNERFSIALEFLRILDGIPDWAGRWTRAAFNGDIEPMPSGLIRAQTLVEAYFPELAQPVTDLSHAIGKFLEINTAFSISVSTHKDTPPSAQQISDLKGSIEPLMSAVGATSRVVGKILATQHAQH